MKLNEEQLKLLTEAGILVPDGANDDSFLTASDEEKLSDYLIASLAPGQEMTKKSYEIRNLLNYLAM